ncbi:sensor histidine kinase [Novosphingobium sp. AP12]|uniref:sensor histidine kinase n=1 Tax=Novosphingobium sp. AP12 TaxID=1144305 RepID=UPI0002720B32|nr:sensor histidine kinase [Novosphingobium sp. AP12]EJL22608.1 histidine kinase [Novosphingobium sp. AP12]
MANRVIDGASIVVGITGSTASIRRSEPLDVVVDLVRALPVGLFVLDAAGLVTVSNLSLTQGETGLAKATDVGLHLDDYLRLLPLDDAGFQEACRQIRMVVDGEAISIDRTYTTVSRERSALTLNAVKFGCRDDMTLVLVSSSKDKERERISKRSQQVKILQAQDEERRRIARELHDGTSQQVALAQLTLEAMRSARTFEEVEEKCLDIESVLCAAQHQMRTMSYVLHPPELTSRGIVQALSTFLTGFGRRTGLTVNFDNMAGRLRKSESLDMALYRVAQEALVNVSKHACATEVNVRLRTVAKHLVLEIEDDGIGIPREIAEGRMQEAIGVGLAGMRARVEALGGIFCVERRLKGTHIGAYFPQRRAHDPAAATVKAQRYCSEPHKARARRST